jgi:hypothetical protein
LSWGFISQDYLFYYHLHNISPKYHLIFNTIATWGSYPPEYYAFIADFIFSNKKSVGRWLSPYKKAIKSWNKYLEDNGINEDTYMEKSNTLRHDTSETILDKLSDEDAERYKLQKLCSIITEDMRYITSWKESEWNYCTICKNPMDENDEVRVTWRNMHVFHTDCSNKIIAENLNWIKNGGVMVDKYQSSNHQMYCPCWRCVLFVLTPTLCHYIQDQRKFGRDDEVLRDDIERMLTFEEYLKSELSKDYDHLALKMKLDLPFYDENDNFYKEGRNSKDLINN